MEQRGTLVYVHGASDRAPQVEDHVARIEQQLRLSGMPFDVLAARWGEQAGASLDRIEQALPLPSTPGRAPRAAPELPGAVDDELLRVLMRDGPLAELERLAGKSVVESEALSLPARREADQLLDICRTDVGWSGEQVQLASGEMAALSTVCRLAAEGVEESSEYSAAHAAPIAESDLVAAAGRAVAASVAAQSAQPHDVLGNVQLRIAEAVLGAAAATLLAGYLGIDVGPGLKRWATDVVLPHRARLMRDAALGPADVLLYQRDGARIRQVVARALTEARARGGPVVALGNSLGSIILVGLLAELDAPRPDLLVTIGSQAPLLATFGALEPLAHASARPPFQPWLNIYDRRDLLGFAAERVWPEQSGIADREVDLGVGFPDAHGATYLSNPEVYRHVRQHPALSNGGGGCDAGPTARRFPIRLGSRSKPLLRLFFGVTEENAYVEVNGEVDAHFGWFRLRTPLGNVKSWRIEGPWFWLTAIGVRRSMFKGDVTFGGNHKGGVRLDFGERVPWSFLRVPALYVTVEDLTGLAELLAARGIPGAAADEDGRREQ